MYLDTISPGCAALTLSDSHFNIGDTLVWSVVLPFSSLVTNIVYQAHKSDVLPRVLSVSNLRKYTLNTHWTWKIYNDSRFQWDMRSAWSAKILTFIWVYADRNVARHVGPFEHLLSTGNPPKKARAWLKSKCPKICAGFPAGTLAQITLLAKVAIKLCKTILVMPSNFDSFRQLNLCEMSVRRGMWSFFSTTCSSFWHLVNPLKKIWLGNLACGIILHALYRYIMP